MRNESIIVYRNPLEKKSWETLGMPPGLVVFLILAAVVGVVGLWLKLQAGLSRMGAGMRTQGGTCKHIHLRIGRGGRAECIYCGAEVE